MTKMGGQHVPKKFNSTRHLHKHILRTIKFEEAKSMTDHVSRIYAMKAALTASAQNVKVLAGVSNTPNFDQVANLTTQCDLTEGAILERIELQFEITTPTLAPIEVLLYKDPDGLLGSQAPAAVFTQTRSLTEFEFRKYAMKYVRLYPSSFNGIAHSKLHISHAAFERVKHFKEGDLLKINFDLTNNSGASPNVTISGKIHWREG